MQPARQLHRSHRQGRPRVLQVQRVPGADGGDVVRRIREDLQVKKQFGPFFLLSKKRVANFYRLFQRELRFWFGCKDVRLRASDPLRVEAGAGPDPGSPNAGQGEDQESERQETRSPEEDAEAKVVNDINRF